MSVSGLCEICESAEAVSRCDRCGALVCRAHFEPDAGYCADCARRLRRDRGEETFRF